jgi:hypothetical protein
MRSAIVVAHPDDETIWAGGYPLRYRGDWTVLCCSVPRIDPVRAIKFFDACAVLGVCGDVLPFTESPPTQALGHLDRLDLSGFDLILTHNAEGEYGHVHHKSVHQHVVRNATCKILTFGYGKGSIRIDLTPDETARKLAALSCYDHTSPTDGKPKWRALLDRYRIDPTVETYNDTGLSN